MSWLGSRPKISANEARALLDNRYCRACVYFMQVHPEYVGKGNCWRCGGSSRYRRLIDFRHARRAPTDREQELQFVYEQFERLIAEGKLTQEMARIHTDPLQDEIRKILDEWETQQVAELSALEHSNA